MATSILDYIFRELAVSYLGRNDLAHVDPDDLAPDSVGKGNEEGELENDADIVHLAAVGRLASQGYVRSRLSLLQARPKSKASNVQAVAGNTALQTDTAEAASVVVNLDTDVFASTDTHMDHIREARMKGYEGDSCGECGNFTLVRNGTCMKCLTCGATSGCS
jgi:ribonucleoside-diphosphate reductase alpha chain